MGLGIDNLSLSHIPDLLESPNISNRVAKGAAYEKHDDNENCDSITELPSASLQLQHLVKSRPKRAKVRAPTRPLLTDLSHSLGEGLETFFTRPGSATPTTLTPLVSPTSEECSSLSFVDSPTMSREDNISGKMSTMTSGETTPIMEERKTKLERQSPLLKGVNWTPRSLSSDNLEKFSPLIGRKSPLAKNKQESMREQHVKFVMEESQCHSLNPPPVTRDTGLRSPSNDSIKSIYQQGNGIKTPLSIQKPRPWSVLGHESKHDYNNDSTKTTPDGLDNGKLLY